MALVALVLSALAFVLALSARARAGGFEQRIEDAERDAKRRTENAVEALEREAETNRRLIAELAAGRSLTADMIAEGRLWRDVDGAEVQRLVDGGGARVLDVRTAQEVAGGKLPGALHIPIEELEERRSELPRDATPLVIYCAAGGRSAAACEFLSSEGWPALLNLEGGIGAWPGPLERPS
ncbi:MAG: rhodanese-like domain-containing protein [Planctomycetota bacterium]